MKLKIYYVLLILFFSGQVLTAENFSLSVPSAIIIDAKTGVVLFEKNADKQYYPASITKIMTGMLACELGKFEDPITVSRSAAYSIERGSSSIALKPNEKVILRDVVYGLMLRSANECGNIIAEYLRGSNQNFARLMNERATLLGCKNTNFVNPHGLHDKNHLTTARDMALIARAAMLNPLFRKVVNTKFYPFPDTNKHKHEERGDLRNKNKFLHPKSKYYYKSCSGIKAGYTKKSLHTFVASATDKKHEVIVVVLNVSDKKIMYAELKKGMEYGLKQFRRRVLVEKDFQIDEIQLTRAASKMSVRTKDIVVADVPLQLSNDDIKREIFIDRDTALPVSAGQNVGKIRFTYKNMVFGESELISEYEVVNVLSWENLKKFFISLPFLIGSACLVCILILLIPIPFDKSKKSFL